MKFDEINQPRHKIYLLIQANKQNIKIESDKIGKKVLVCAKIFFVFNEVLMNKKSKNQMTFQSIYHSFNLSNIEKLIRLFDNFFVCLFVFLLVSLLIN